ncbi:F0F1 ATP synthase subunit gamma [Sulfurirhabdus autotrophica]|uniref:F-type H+-transporting ATPase subunit gamma n=1 Tax=Sulfurirhabdus autotrophica TaxID=1706046 RepID=A0A4R3YDR7_9PROT|nr:FoF1 ATP synthase subunit gamma [Sulfurirhabdus autotrophica]TCV90277.1 F-type H+-transporting ATPase subunit gamma [Sulfurirhabdus autotrophica]
MSRRRNLQQRVESLGEIQSIMGAMKNLAFMETRKLAQFLTSQQQSVASIELAANDFVSFYGNTLPQHKAINEVYLVIGSERGFCGDFNEKLVEVVFSYQPDMTIQPPIVAIGNRLESKLRNQPSLVTIIEGASVTEEVEPIITQIANRLVEMQKALTQGTVLGVTAFYHSDEANGIKVRRLLPLPKTTQPDLHYSHPPLLNLAPLEFYAGLTEHYLYAALHETIYSSLMVENRYRLEHMDNAIRQMDKKLSQLKLKYNALRQEEIIEEIEIIMLSVETLTSSTT